MEPLVIARAIGKVYKDDRFWKSIVNKMNCGPSDGGCYTCAKAIIAAVGDGVLVRLESSLQGGQTEHFGALIDGRIYDFSGVYSTSTSWIKAFVEQESIFDRQLFYATGRDMNKTHAGNDEVESDIVALLKESMAGHLPVVALPDPLDTDEDHCSPSM